RRAHVRARWAAGFAAAILATVVIAVALWPGGTAARAPHLRLVVFTKQGPNIVARISDPYAPAAQLTAAFRAHGLNINVQTLAVSPSLVGTIVYSDVNSIRELQTGDCMSGGGGRCWIGMVIPANFTGQGNVSVGRAAKSGEPYASSAEVFGPGEALHCTELLDQPVSKAVAVLRAKGLNARWQLGSSDGTSTNESSQPGGYVVGGTALSSTTVLVDVSAQPLDSPSFRRYEAAANHGC
ncbi:MAG: hypothetical protein M3P18_16370, partial [Actinomycetota bacterium]|nr:hypothetical protein [Actinomycetota bacterium]